MSASVFGLLVGLIGLVVSGTITWFLISRQGKYSLDQRLSAFRQRVEACQGERTSRSVITEDTSFPQILRQMSVGMGRVISLVVPLSEQEREKLSKLLALAGMRQREALPVFLMVKMMLFSVLGIGMGILFPQLHSLGENLIVLGLAVVASAIIGGILPETVVRRIASRRQHAFAEGLPHALDLMVLCLESGLTFERGLVLVSQELKSLAPELATELMALEAELRLTEDRRASLHALFEKTGVEGLRDFALAISQGERFGTPLTQSMQNIARTERIQRRARIEAQAARLPVLISLPMLLLVVPGTIMLVAGPAFLQAMSALGGFGN